MIWNKKFQDIFLYSTILACGDRKPTWRSQVWRLAKLSWHDLKTLYYSSFTELSKIMISKLQTPSTNPDCKWLDTYVKEIHWYLLSNIEVHQSSALKQLFPNESIFALMSHFLLTKFDHLTHYIDPHLDDVCMENDGPRV